MIKSRWERAIENWEELTEEIKAKWELLTDEELVQINGDREVLVRILQVHYGYSRYESSKQVDGWIDRRKVHTKAE